MTEEEGPEEDSEGAVCLLKREVREIIPAAAAALWLNRDEAGFYGLQVLLGKRSNSGRC